MRKFAMLISAASLILPASSCSTLQAARSRVCDNKEIVRVQVEYQISEAASVDDPIKYMAIMASLALTLAALDKCPKPI